MKKNQFIKLIRETVSKEVRRAVRMELNEILNPPDNSVKTFNEQIQNGVQMQRQAEVSQPDVEYTKNATLNELLNETANDMKAYPTAGGRTLTAADAIGGKGQLAAAMGLPSLGQNGGPATVQEMVPADRQGAPIPDAVSKALTKDYRGLMKAINKKRGIK